MPPWLPPCGPNAGPCRGSSVPDLEVAGLCLPPAGAVGPQHARVIPSSGTNNILHFSASLQAWPSLDKPHLTGRRQRQPELKCLGSEAAAGSKSEPGCLATCSSPLHHPATEAVAASAPKGCFPLSVLLFPPTQLHRGLGEGLQMVASENERCITSNKEKVIQTNLKVKCFGQSLNLFVASFSMQ